MASFRSATSTQAYALGPELARGGEGAIHLVEGFKDLVAKVYLKPPEPAKAEKIRAMTAVANAELLKIAAWPQDGLLGRDGKLVGFVMPRIGSRSDAHELYSPRSRATSFPEADFRFLVHVAGNVARAFATLHAAGHIIGDVNHGHMLVGGDGRVVMIDADSFQVSVAGKLYTCDVGVPLFTAPELQNRPFRGLQRTPDHDSFGLAVMIFHLLMMGRHPFAGVWQGTGDMPIERAIVERRYAYGAGAAQRQMKPPPGTAPVASFGPAIEALFERAFAKAGSRPTARAWVDVLEALKRGLVKCGSNDAHFHASHVGSCPWCPIERATGVRLFGTKLSTTAALELPIDIGILWSRIMQTSPPPPDPPIPSTAAWSPPVGVDLPNLWPKRLRKGGSLFMAAATVAACNTVLGDDIPALAYLGILAAAYSLWPRPDCAKLAAATAEIKLKQARYETLKKQWGSEASTVAFHTLKQQLEMAHSQLKGLPAERTRLLDELQRGQEKIQRRKYLERFRIRNATIPDIGPSRRATLAAFGIETAWDIKQGAIHRIPGFGPVLVSNLMEFRRAHEANFRFNPALPIDPADIAQIDAQLRRRQGELVEQLRSGAGKLSSLSTDVPSARARLLPLMQQAWDEVQIATLKQAAA